MQSFTSAEFVRRSAAKLPCTEQMCMSYAAEGVEPNGAGICFGLAVAVRELAARECGGGHSPTPSRKPGEGAQARPLSVFANAEHHSIKNRILLCTEDTARRSASCCMCSKKL